MGISFSHLPFSRRPPKGAPDGGPQAVSHRPAPIPPIGIKGRAKRQRRRPKPALGMRKQRKARHPARNRRYLLPAKPRRPRKGTSASFGQPSGLKKNPSITAASTRMKSEGTNPGNSTSNRPHWGFCFFFNMEACLLLSRKPAADCYCSSVGKSSPGGRRFTGRPLAQIGVRYGTPVKILHFGHRIVPASTESRLKRVLGAASTRTNTAFVAPPGSRSSTSSGAKLENTTPT